MLERVLPRGRRRYAAGLGVLFAGLSLAPVAASQPTAGMHAHAAGNGSPIVAGGYGQGGYGHDGSSQGGQAGGAGSDWGGPSGGGYGQSSGAGSGGSYGSSGGGYGQSGYGQSTPAPAPAPTASPQDGGNSQGGGYGSNGGGYGQSGYSGQSGSSASPSAVAASASSSTSAHSSSSSTHASSGWGHTTSSSHQTSSHYGASSGYGSSHSSTSSTSATASSATASTAHTATTTATATTPATTAASTASADVVATPAPTAPAASASTPAAAAPATSSPASPAHKSRPSATHKASHHKRSSARKRAGRPSAARRAGATARARTVAAARAATAAAAARTAAATRSAAAAKRPRRPATHHRASGTPAPIATVGHALTQVPALVGNLVPLPVPDWSKPIIFVLVLLCVLLGLRLWWTGHRARRLDVQREQLAADLASIQSALIPEIPETLGGLGVSVAYQPADGPGAGGDFYDVFALDANRVAIIVGDVSGHGRDALGRAAHMHYTLRAYVEMGLEPRAALKLAGRVQGASDDDLFATVAVAVHDAEAGTLTYATAGHPAPVLDGLGAHESLAGSASPPLGWGAPTGRRQTTIPFADGSRACFFTDGVTEARVGDHLLGRDRLGEIFAELEPGSSAQRVLERVRGEAGEVNDDMAACVIEATGASAGHEQRVEELELSSSQLDSGQGERFLSACGVGADEAESVLDSARAIASEHGVAILRAELDGALATARATGPAPGVPGTPAQV